MATVTVVGLISVFFTDFIHAETVKDKSEIQDERATIKKNLSKAEAEIADVLIDLREINREIEQNNKELKSNKKAIKEIGIEIEDNEKEIEERKAEIDKIEAKIEKRFEILKDRAVSLQKNGGDIGYLEVIFGSQSFSDFVNRLSAVTKISDSDQELIEEQEADKLEVEEQKEKMEEKREELNLNQAELKEIQKLIDKQKIENKEKQKELKDKEKELKTKKEKLKIKDNNLASLEAEIEKAEAQKEQSNANNNSKASSEGTGALVWPTDGGYVSSQMGTRWNKQHKGIDIARTDKSSVPSIYAAESGVVESASFNNGGYGNKIVINHDNGLKTVYAHLSSMNVSAGQKVGRGQKIGVMGETGRSTGIHLHFEVYKNGALQNPLSYVGN